MGAVVSVRDQRDPAAKHEQILLRACAVVADAIVPHLAAYPRRNGHVESARSGLVMCAVRRENGFCAAIFAQRRICRRDDVFAVDKDAERTLVALGTAVEDVYPRFAKLCKAAAALVEHYAVFTAACRPRGRHFGRRALEPIVLRHAAGDKALPHPRDRFAVALGRGHQHPDRRKARRCGKQRFDRPRRERLGQRRQDHPLVVGHVRIDDVFAAREVYRLVKAEPPQIAGVFEPRQFGCGGVRRDRRGECGGVGRDHFVFALSRQRKRIYPVRAVLVVALLVEREVAALTDPPKAVTAHPPHLEQRTARRTAKFAPRRRSDEQLGHQVLERRPRPRSERGKQRPKPTCVERRPLARRTCPRARYRDREPRLGREQVVMPVRGARSRVDTAHEKSPLLVGKHLKIRPFDELGGKPFALYAAHRRAKCAHRLRAGDKVAAVDKGDVFGRSDAAVAAIPSGEMPAPLGKTDDARQL